MKKLFTINFSTLIILSINTFFLFSLNCVAQKQGQERIDSLQTALKNYDVERTELNKTSYDIADSNKVKILTSLSVALRNTGDYKLAKQYAEDALSISEKINFKTGIINACNYIGNAYRQLGNYPAALEKYFAALKIANEIGNKKGISGCLNYIGVIYYFQGNYSEALKNYLSALKISEETGNKDGISVAYNNIGGIHQTQKNYKEALKNYLAALKINESTGDKRAMSASYNNIGIIYDLEEKYPDALKNYFDAVKICKELGDKNGTASAYNNIGGIYYNQDKYQDALENLLAALKIREEIGDKAGIANSYNNIGELNIKLKKYSEAKKYLNDGLSLSKEIGSIDDIKNCYSGLIELDSATSNWKDAFLHHKLYIIYRDSLENDESIKNQTQTEMQYEFDKKEAATKAEQGKKNVISQKELQKQKMVRNGFVGGFAIVFLFAGVFFRQRNKTKQEKKRSDDLLLNILPTEVAEELKTTGGAKAKAFTMVTVMFTDFKDFTSVSEKVSAELLVDEIHHCFSAFDHIIEKHKIEKIKTIGDAYLCASGLPVSNYTHAVDMLNAAFEIRDFMLQRKQQKEAKGEIPFELRIGIHTGPVVAGIVGVKKYAYDIWGDTVNVAARMEQICEPGKINISGSTYELVNTKFNCEHRGKIEAKNKGMIDMFFVERLNKL